MNLSPFKKEKHLIRLSCRHLLLKTLVLWIGLLFPSKIYCQNLLGEVRNKNGQVLPFSLIRVENIHDHKIIAQQMSDSLGVFRISVAPGLLKLEVYALGYSKYRSDSFQVRSREELTKLNPFFLTLDSASLHGVEIVSAKRVFIEYHGDKAILNLGDMPIAAELTGAQALQLMPGVMANGSSFTIVGKGHTEIWLNGKPTRLDLNSIPATQIERIEIIENPSGAYDANIEAIINVVLKKWSQDGFSGQFSGNYRQGFYPGGEGSTLINGNSGKWISHVTMTGASSKTYEQSYQLNYFPSILNEVNQQQVTTGQNLFLNAGTEWKPSIHQTMDLEAEVKKERSPLSTDNSLYNFYSSKSFADSSTNSLTKTQSGDLSGSIRLSHTATLDTMGKMLNLCMEYYSLQEKETNDYLFQFLNKDGMAQYVDQLYYSQRMSTSTVFAVKGNYIHPLSKSQKIDVGFKVSVPGINSVIDFYSAANPSLVKWEHISERSSNFTSREHIYASYITWSGSWKKLEIQSGLRGEYTEGSGAFNSLPQKHYAYSDLFPSTTITYNGSEQHTVILSYSRKINRPDFSMLNPYLAYSGPYSVFVGSPDLKPQYNNNLSLTWLILHKYYVVFFFNHKHNNINQISEQDDLTKITTYRLYNFEAEASGVFINLPVTVCSWLKLNNSGTFCYQKEWGVIQDIGFSGHTLLFQLQAMQTVTLPYSIRFNSTINYRSSAIAGIIKTGPLAYYGFSFGRSFAKNKLDLALKAEDVFHSYTDTYTVRFGNQDKSGYHKRDMQSLVLSLAWKFEKGRKANASELENAAEDEKSRVK
jgi:outer membrane receptor for ferrienterochelin and colicin